MDSREAGESPARSRHCNGEPIYKCHWYNWEGVKKAMILSQETYLFNNLRNTHGVWVIDYF